ELDGSSAGVGASGLTLTGGGSTVRGLVVNRFSSAHGIKVSSNNNVIVGNFLGTDPAGSVAEGNGNGVRLEGGASFNRIGTNGDGVNDFGERNILGGNNGGVDIDNASFNVIAGNYI